MANLSQIKKGATTYDLKALALKYIAGTGTAAVTSSPYTYAKWEASAPEITSLYDGLTILYKVPVAGNGSYGTCLQINSLGYHPVVVQTNSMISSRYAVGSIILLTYHSGLSGTVYANSASSSTINGVWVCVNNYVDGNSTAWIIEAIYSQHIAKNAIYRYQLLFTYSDTELIAANTVSNSIATDKTLMNDEFDPFKPIYYYGTTTTIGDTKYISNWALFTMYHSLDLRYSFNTGSTLVANKSVYLVCVPQANGKVKFHTNPIVQDLPTTEDGLVYLYLGRAYTATHLTLYHHHPIYYFKDGAIHEWTNELNYHHATGSWNGLTYTALSVNGAPTLSFTVPTGTTSSSVALGNHGHGYLNNNGTLTTTGTMSTADTIIFGDASASDKLTASPMSAGTSTLLNSLGEGSSPAQMGDYIIAQYAGGGSTTSTYHRRKLSNILTATNITTGLGNTPVARATADASGNTISSTYAKKTDLDTLVAATDAMVFKGTLGTGGTITALPNSHTRGDTYRVITAGTYAGVVCEVGDLVMCITSSTSASNSHWTVAQTNIDGAVVGPASATDAHVAVFSGTGGKLIKDSGFTIAKSVPSDAKFTDTTYTVTDSGSGNVVTGVSLSGTTITVTKGNVAASSHSHGNILSGGTMTATIGIANGDRLVLVDADGNKIAGSSITFSASTATSSVLSQAGTWVAMYTHPTGDGNKHVPATGTTNNGKFLQAGSTAGALSWVALNGTITGTPGASKTLTAFSQSNGNVVATFSDISIPFSSVTTRPTTLAGYGITDAAASDHTHTLSLATDTGASVITLSHGGKYKLTAGGKTLIFTMPTDNNTNYYHKTGSWSGLTYTAGKVGSPDDLAFTIPTGTTNTTVALGNHTHTTSLTKTGTSQIDLAAGTVYTLSAGGTTVVFKTPADGNTDTKVTNTVSTTSKFYVTGQTSSTTSTGTQIFDTGVYVTTTSGELNALRYRINEKAYIHYDTTDDVIAFTFV